MEKYGSIDTGLPTTASKEGVQTVKPAKGRRSMLKRAILISGAGALLGWKLLDGQLLSNFGLATPSSIGSGIAWSACPDLTEYDCAYLSVPLDYSNPMPNETVSLALRRLPSTAPKKDYMGTLFINPGGPGGSGTFAVLSQGPSLTKILKGRYDILSWDPRGVNMTTPSLDCFPTEYDEYMQEAKQNGMGLPFQAFGEGGKAAELAWFTKTDAYYRSSIASCGRNGNQKMLKSVSTAYVVRDMVRILEALGEDERGMQYWGFSYGTILGATFSAMFPEKVHRVLLDGVSSARLYTTDMFDWGRSGMDDTNKVWTGFLKSCASAGPERCALAKGGDTTDSIRERIETLTAKLIEQPVEAPWGGVASGIVTASDLKQAIFKALYAPKKWPLLANALATLEAGDAVPIAAYVNEPSPQGDPLTARQDPLDNIFGRHLTKTWSPLSTEAIMCSDTDQSVAHSGAPSAESFLSYSRELGEMSITGETWAHWVGKCRLWNYTATEAYRGPWKVEDGLKKTNFPVMFLGVTADPVTPLSAAKDMSLGFGNESATLLIQDGFGHCSGAHPSICTAKTIAAYFLEGKVPEYGTVCKSPDDYLFPVDGGEDLMATMSSEDRELVEAMEKLAEGIAAW